MTSLSKKLTTIVGHAFDGADLPSELGYVTVSDRPDLAQFQCNGAMAAARIAKKSPRDVAGDIISKIEGLPELSKVEIAGPGFINIDVQDAYLTDHLSEILIDDRFGVPDIGKNETIVLDYGGPNIAKPMHVGHLRSSIIGDTLRRMCKFAGYNTIGDVHMGDWGTPMGMILSEMEISGFRGELTMDDLEEIYPKAAQACKADTERAEKARLATKLLQDGDQASVATWQTFIDVSVAGMKANFDALGVEFDEWKGESHAHPFIADMAEELKSKGIAIESDGALVIAVEEEGDNKEYPPLILYKSDGAVMYGTTDLGTIIDRMQSYNPAKIIYVVDQRQSLHFEQVFRAARKGGLVPDGVELTHAGFGTMNGIDGKPFKTRAGGVMRLEDLIRMAIDKATERLNEADLATDMDEHERTDVAHKVAIAAIKFADLQNNRVADYVFDLDRFTSFEGKTGPYLLYQTVRIRSLLSKAEGQEIDYANAPIVIHDDERELALLMSEFPNHFEHALKDYAPHVLCDYAFKLAQCFSSFYGRCHILSEENLELRSSRLRLCKETHALLNAILGLLGIKTPERM